MSQPLWQPSPERIGTTNLVRFMDRVNARHGLDLQDYDTLWAWSVAEKERFWTDFWDFCDVIAESRGRRAAVDVDKLPGARYFPDARLNFAENLLRPGRRSVPDDSPAIIFQGEGQGLRTLSWAELEAAVSRLAQALAATGLKPGDRVGAYVANLPETVIAMLAATSIGAIWSSCSPDFGVRGVLDRFDQIEPKLLIAVDGYFWEGRRFDTLEKLPEIIAGLPSLEQVIVVPYASDRPHLAGLPNAASLPEVVAPYAPRPIGFTGMGFNDPLYILFSSGTTGPPKCILHGIGGTLLQHLKEHRLHCDVKAGERVFYFTTCGWMMWNWLASALASQATLVLYDGSPFHPDGNVLFDFADRARINLFGTSAKFLDAVAKAGLEPKHTHDLSTVRLITSTGSPLAPEGFDFVYRGIKSDVHLASVSGGTDIIACFVGGNPMGPVWRGEIQARALAMAVDVFDDDGRPLEGEKGELVCTSSFPSMPLGFWNDPDGKKYHDAYFARFPNTWCHGDYVALTEHGGIVIYGRSDAVLNPGGVRIGTAEIYRQVERVDEVLEALVIGQDWQGDVRVVLFVRLRDGAVLDDTLEDKIKAQVRDNASPRHVPARILQVADIPRTKSGKIVELAVRDVVHGR
ncbi:MAG: acetoacetate--CoA ligase, partial [Kiloniellales bacterium]